MEAGDLHRSDSISGTACKQRHDDLNAAAAEIERNCSTGGWHSMNAMD
jgi:hypothetical protein